MAEGIISAFARVQITFATLFLIWLWIVRARSALRAAQDKGDALLWLALASYTLGAAAVFYFWHAPALHSPLILASFFLGCAGLVLALLGRGKGRLATAVACCGLAVSWLPLFPP